MKTQLLIGALLPCLMIGLFENAAAHGGTYRGPGDIVPPGGGNSGGSGNPTTPGPGGPTTPSPGGGTSPGPRSPNAPAGTPGGSPGRPQTPGAGGAGSDLTVWDFWWGFNKAPYLNLKARVYDGAVQTGSDEFFLGQGEASQAKNSLRPSQAQIRELVVPALLQTLEREQSNDVLTGAMIALAKIGDVQDESGESAFEAILARFLESGNQEVSETAATALGVLANDSSVPILTSLMQDGAEGRRLVGNKLEVPYRTRAFAAYGLGLIGHRSASNAMRQRIVASLVEILDAPHFSTRDIKVAAMTALGLTALDPLADARLLEARQQEPSVEAALSFETQVRYLLDYLDPGQQRENGTTRHDFVRAHAATALGRLLCAAPDSCRRGLKASVFEMFRELVGPHSKERNELQGSVALALGMFGDADMDPLDVELRELLTRLSRDADLQTKRFALMALAQAGSRRGDGEQVLAAVDSTREVLLNQLRAGRTLKPWAALALGVFGNALLAEDLGLDRAASALLRSETIDMRRPSESGAYCLALGLRHDVQAREILVEKLDFFKGSDDARGYAAVGLGLLGDRSSIALIEDIVVQSQYRSDLLREAAVALGLLGDKDMLPELIGMLATAKGLHSQASISAALGTIGDWRSIDPLIALLEREDITEAARGFAAAALGIVCDKEMLPWNSPVSIGINYRASTNTLIDGMGGGLLEIL